MFRNATTPRASRLSRMRASLRSQSEIAAIAATGRVVAEAISAGAEAAVAGACTAEVEQAVAEVFAIRGAEPVLREGAAVAASRRFPAVCCTSVNEVALHGVPGGRVLRDGDLLTIDAACRLDGWCADAARTIAIGEIDGTRKRLLATADACMACALEAIRPGRRWSEVAALMQDVVESAGFSIVTGWTGHGIGRTLHEWPPVPATLTEALLAGEDFTLLPGMVLAIEPVVVLQPPSPRSGECARGVAVRTGVDGWSVETLSGSPACHLEHTVAVLRSGASALTAAETPVRQLQGSPA